LEQIIHKLNQYYRANEEVLFGYLFGSFAKNRSRSRSDIDIAVYLSNYHRESAYENKMKDILALQDIFKRPVDLILFNEAPPLLKHEIFKTGIIFIEREHFTLVEYKVRNYHQYLNQLYIINRFFEKNKLAIQGENSDGQPQYH
jgi:Predicted nucleotidyltransferases